MIFLIGMALAAAPPPKTSEAQRAEAIRWGEEAADTIRDEGEALAAAYALLGRLTGKDPAAMQALTLPEGGATAISVAPDGKPVLRHFTWAEFFAHLPKDKPVIEENMPKALVRVDRDIAMVWGRYEVTVDGKFLHCGTDHFDLVRVEGKWRILNITWNQVTTGCGR